MCMFHCTCKIDDGKQEKNKCLNKGYKNTERHNRQWCQKKAGKAEQNRKHDFMSHHVSKKTEGQGKDSGSVSDNFDDENQGTHPPYRTHEMFDVFGSMVFDSDDMGKNHHNQRTG